ncbi:hypothetical protein V2G26_014441 [Clonostachys chloroleuca]
MSCSPVEEKPGWPVWSETFRNIIAGEARFADNNESNFCRIIPLISQQIHYVTREYATDSYPLSDIEVHLHDIWYACIQATGRHIWGSRTEPDTLVVALASLKVSGPLLRPSQRLIDSGDANESVTFSDNREFWSDLPLFAVSLIDEFTHRFHQPDYGAGYCFNLATFVGRLLSVGILMALVFVFSPYSEKHWRSPTHCQKQTRTQNKSRLQLLTGPHHSKTVCIH